MLKIAQKIYVIYTALIFIVQMVIYCPLIILVFLVTNEKIGGSFAYWLLDKWIRTLNFSGIFFRFKGRQYIQKDKAYIYVANHRSYMDPPAMIRAIPGQFRPLGKHEILKVPFFGWMYKYVVVVVDRSSLKSKVMSLKALKSKLEAGLSILIFPEGRINETDKPLTPFFDGAFRLAIDMKATIIPTVIYNSGKVLPSGNFGAIQPGTITIEFLPPISTEKMNAANDTNMLKDLVYKQIEEKLVGQHL
jgi:1-acyl-sn-glycerol-3-phosphate acyltransferase